MDEMQQKSRILVVEDEADIQIVLCVYLKYAGFEVRGVSNGQEAIHAIAEFNPQLIVLDMMMQPVDGWEVLNWLQANPHTAPIAVIVLTALSHIAHQVHGLEEGAVEYITKPVQPSKLVERIRAILSLSEEQRGLLRHRRMEEQRKVLDSLYAPQPDEFIY